MGINVSVHTDAKCIACLTLPKDKTPRIAMTWQQSGYDFLATFARNDNVMTIHIIDGGKIVDDVEMPYPKAASASLIDRLWKDLNLKKMAECLIAQASQSGKIEGESIDSLFA
jgi:hypothetical protein